jgi:predicted kinase
MLSHYPVDIGTAKHIGQIGIKAYLSGHVHCTKGTSPGGNDWEWYDRNAKPTDDQTFGTCFFSTGTTDVLLQKHGQIFKNITCLDQNIVSQKQSNSLTQHAAQAFKCNPKFVSKFEREDPLNKGNIVCGFICRKKGPMQGSLFITHVHGVRTESQLIYGTPKLEYPYENTSSKKFKQLTADKVYVAEKWNGMNVVFFKYFDAHGNIYITGKSKGTPFLTDGDFGNFLSLTKEALQFDGNFMTEDLHPDLMLLMAENVQSISMELCGRKEPHLVKYNFDLALKPLFVTFDDGRIRPYQDPNSGALISNQNIEQSCTTLQNADLKINEQYRLANNLPHKYEYEHFAVEGKVLYLMDAEGFLIDRTMYKIKPSDIEDVHWQSFDNNMQGRVMEAVEKLGAAEEEVNEKSLQQELDMGPKEWDRFGKSVMQYYDILQKQDEEDNREVVVLVGLPGSGKSTVAERLVEKGYTRVNQDDLGSRNKYKGIMVEAIKAGKKVIIDRVNFDRQQRQSWIDLAHKLGVVNVRCVWLKVDKDTCKTRVANRVNHPTIKDAETGNHVIDKFDKLFEEPSVAEGFINVEVYSNDSTDSIVNKIIDEQVKYKLTQS